MSIRHYGMFGMYEMVDVPDDLTKAVVKFYDYKVVNNRQCEDNGIEEEGTRLDFSHTINLRNGKGYVYSKDYVASVAFNAASKEFFGH